MTPVSDQACEPVGSFLAGRPKIRTAGMPKAATSADSAAMVSGE